MRERKAKVTRAWAVVNSHDGSLAYERENDEWMYMICGSREAAESLLAGEYTPQAGTEQVIPVEIRPVKPRRKK